MYLVLLETSGNQSYIFSTNKLKENIGASELTSRAGTEWVLRAVRAIQRKKRWWKPNDTIEKTRQKLLDTNTLNLPLEMNPHARIEILVATSGKALILVRDRVDGQRIIRWVTRKVLRFAPGVDICGVISEEFDWESNKLGEIVKDVHDRFESVRAKRPSQELRFLRLPVIDECVTSGLPAAWVDKKTPDGKAKVRSEVSHRKRIASKDGIDRIVSLLRCKREDLDVLRSLAALDEEIDEEGNGTQGLDWMAVVHADGNGLGEIFLNFQQHIDAIAQLDENHNRVYANRLREFSIALDICTENAFLSALDRCLEPNKNIAPIAPLVLGGDDLTVVCDAKVAIPFTVAFLQAFERETAKAQALIVEKKETGIVLDVVPKITKQALGVGRLSICAGVAIVKPHFPFSVAYHLAEQLLKSAKTVKTKVTQKHEGDKEKPYPCSAIDFHILYDSSGTDLDTIRKKQQGALGLPYCYFVLLRLMSLLVNEQPKKHGVLKIIILVLLVLNKLVKMKRQEQTYLYNSPYVVSDINEIPEENGRAWAERHDWNGLVAKAKAIAPDPDLDIENDRKLPNGQIHTLRSHLYMGMDAADGYYQLIKDRYDFTNFRDGEDSLFKLDPSSGIFTTSAIDAMDVMSFLNFDLQMEQSVNP